ncbi:hypothetical protein H4684_002775 [Desulfomicrobium macestii]|uniref:DNA-binding protein n=1 Tax=Desulfomicrobium macestii TaxID=90731 RepID=A0ABR9H5Y2_9BACT|nr:hypothetical protein [Desulfomicrobium macestii]MBE1426114.1 hypothetical protein [Desulfomicrobium macestii]
MVMNDEKAKYTDIEDHVLLNEFNELAAKWGKPFVPRTKVGIFSEGLLHPRTLANLDCLGIGPGKIIMGKRVFYKTPDLIAWMQGRVKKQAA